MGIAYNPATATLDMVNPPVDITGKLNLDQTTPQTTVGTFSFPRGLFGTTSDYDGHTPIQGYGSSVDHLTPDVTNVISTQTGPSEFFTVNAPNIINSSISYDKGTFIDTTMEFSVYAIQLDGSRRVVNSTYGYLEDYTSTNFQYFLEWSDGGGDGTTSKYVIYCYDYNTGLEYYKDMGMNTSIIIPNWTGWSPTIATFYDYYGFYATPTGSLVNDNQWCVWAYKTTNGEKTYSAVRGEIYDQNYDGGWKTIISWDDMSVDGYILRNNTTGYYIDVGNVFSYEDDGTYPSPWVLGNPTITPASYIQYFDLIRLYNDSVNYFRVDGLGNIETTGGLSFNGDLNLNNHYITNGFQPGGSTFIGNGAGYLATYAGSAIMIGQEAGSQATNAYGAIIIGAGAGVYAQHAQNMTAIGNSSGRYADYAYYSTFIGYNCGYGATMANNSLGFGSEALRDSVYAHDSIAIGPAALNNARYAAFTLALGRDAGYSSSNIANSILIGAFCAVADTVDNTSSGTSICIGNYSGTGGFKDSISLGHGVVNSAVNQFNVGNALFINGIYASDTKSSTALTTISIGIGTNVPTAALHLKAGTATASTAPLKFTSGTLNTNPEAGAIEFLTDDYYATQTTSTLRKKFLFNIGKITTVTDTYGILVTDETVICDKATAFTVTLPTAVVGQKFDIKNIGVGVVTVDGTGTDTIDSALTQSLIQYENMTIQCSSANSWIIL